MANELGISSVSGGYQSQSELLVQTYKQTEQPKVDTLTAKQQTLEQNQAFFNSLFSKINSVSNAIDAFTGATSQEKFVTRKVGVSDATVVNVTSDKDALLGINTVKVGSLATNDILVSDRFQLTNNTGNNAVGTEDENIEETNSSDNNKTKFKAGDYNFRVINGDKEPLEVSLTLTGNETTEDTLNKIVNAINRAVSAAADQAEEDGDEYFGINASLIKDTESTARITFIAQGQGSANSISFDEDTNGILADLGFKNNLKSGGNNNRTAFTETNAGFKTTNVSSLDAKLEVNGIPITRSSNSIENVLPGLNIKLLKPQDADELPVTLTTTVDSSKVESMIQPLFSAYNELLKSLRDNTTLMRSDSTISGLFNRLRAVTSTAISNDNTNDFKYLTEIGITINQDGTIGIGDQDEFLKQLEDDPEKVARLFTSPDSFANKLATAVENYAGSGGIIKARTLSFGTQIDYTKERIVALEERIDRQAQSLREEYESMLAVFLEAQNQYSSFTAMSSGGTGG